MGSSQVVKTLSRSQVIYYPLIFYYYGLILNEMYAMLL